MTRLLPILICLCMAGALVADPGSAPEGFVPAEGTQTEPYTDTGWASEIVHEASGIRLVFIPAGSFTMGSPVDEVGRQEDEGPQHQVTVSQPFYLGKYEVTQAEWTRQMGDNPSFFKGEQQPVEWTTEPQIREFLAKLNGGGRRFFRLPTEAEWEYACRAGTTTPFTYGDTLTAEQANVNGTYGYGGHTSGVYHKQPVDVGSYAPNAWGLHDMHGNVEERCQTTYAKYTDEPRQAYDEEEAATWNVFRGGGWYTRPSLCRSANRYAEPRLGTSCSGLRLLVTLR